ncbi:helix-turn-helix domain-containing protein [Natrarchaeobaculum aegyptiacum]|uniref:Bacterio-opsin activator n=1 Tax=Natrarchaeobaculum aegyptiacum TaxID=745377 RepID=A0A2Z2HVD4_9EURY|nr:helix-turn-helix domain-containing protein [Natrarchaeobaculum aegyptiacum]ARS91160.1 hypothetical protein B1756_16455 [Natrarchaeobaculum aegyptiacum]
MSVVATVAVPASAFPLGTLLESDPAVHLSVEAVVPTADEPIPYLWVPDGTDEITDRLEEIPVVAAATVVDEFEETLLVRIGWTDGVNGVLESIRRADGIVTSAEGRTDRWTFRIRFSNYDALSTFYVECSKHDVEVELLEVYEPTTPEQNRRYGLTAGQRDLVIAAYEAGYFDVPRETTLVELGEELEISDSAVSQRLRRGLAALIGATLVAEDDGGLIHDPFAEFDDDGSAGSDVESSVAHESSLDGDEP